MPELETRDINGVEIFATGTHNGDIYTQKDIEKIVESFHATKDMMKPFVKFGHNKDQKFAQSDGLPALGWVENLRVNGNKVVADLKRIPKKVHDLISTGAFRRVSIELFMEKMLGDKKFEKVLSAVALLGANIPSVKSLKDIIDLFNEKFREELKSYDERDKDFKVYSLDTNKISIKKEGINMSEEIMKELRQQKSEQEKVFKEKEKSFEEVIEKKDEVIAEKDKEIDGLKADNKVKSDEIAKGEEAKKLTEITSKVDKFIEEKHLLPADKEKTVNTLLKLYSDEDMTKVFTETIEKVNIDVHTEEQAKLKAEAKKNEAHDAEFEDEEKHEKIKQYMEKHKVTYGVAFDKVSLDEKS